MQPFRLATTTQHDPQHAASELVQQLGDCHAHTLAFIYATDPFAAYFNNIIEQLREETGIPHWVGSIGQGVCCTRREYYDEAAVVVMVTDILRQHFHVFTDPAQIDARHGNEGLHFSVVHGDPRNGQLPELISRLPDQLGNGYLVGGLTSASQYYYQYADTVTEGQLSGVVFEPQVEVITALSQGCSPIGPVHTISDCEGHIVQGIDGRPALDVMYEDIGEVLARDIQRAAGYIFAGFPVRSSDTGDYLVRNLIGVDPKHKYIAIGEYLQNDRPIMFCRRDGQTAIADMERMLADIKKRLPREPKGGLYFTCLGRGRHLFGEDSAELNLIADRLGDIPLVGFYANGEIAGQRLYGYTGVLTLFI